jgi:hypothetical protein
LNFHKEIIEHINIYPPVVFDSRAQNNCLLFQIPALFSDGHSLEEKSGKHCRGVSARDAKTTPAEESLFFRSF